MRAGKLAWGSRRAIPEFDEVRRTRSRADGGIELVAVNTTPFVGGRVAIQAKRYATHHKVDIAAVREIAGFAEALTRPSVQRFRP